MCLEISFVFVLWNARMYLKTDIDRRLGISFQITTIWNLDDKMMNNGPFSENSLFIQVKHDLTLEAVMINIFFKGFQIKMLPTLSNMSPIFSRIFCTVCVCPGFASHWFLKILKWLEALYLIRWTQNNSKICRIVFIVFFQKCIWTFYTM